MKALILLLFVGSAVAQTVPTNPDVSESTKSQTICVSGWTSTVRPPVAYTNKLKKKLMTESGLPWRRAAEFELDHRVPLTLGGAPRDSNNLWLQSWTPIAPAAYNGETGAHVKDKLEVRLNKLVCTGVLPLAEAQECIFKDWRECSRIHPPKGK